MKVLISSLGEAPGVVTTMIDALKEKEGIVIEKAVAISTNDVWITEGVEWLKTHIETYYNPPVLFEPKHLSFEDVIKPEHAQQYRDFAKETIRNHIRKGAQVYVCIAGGRKSMSAAMYDAVQGTGAEDVYHVTAKTMVSGRQVDIEVGAFETLDSKSEEERLPYLHPSQELCFLIHCPFGQTRPDDERSLEEIWQTSGGIRRNNNFYKLD